METYILFFLAAILAGAINTMAVGGLAGGYVGGMLSGGMDRRILRGVVIVIGFAVAGYYCYTLVGAPQFHVGGE